MSFWGLTGEFDMDENVYPLHLLCYTFTFFLHIFYNFSLCFGPSMDDNLFLLIIEVSNIYQFNKHQISSTCQLFEKIFKFWHFWEILVSFLALPGGSHMDEKLLLLKIVQILALKTNNVRNGLFRIWQMTYRCYIKNLFCVYIIMDLYDF